MGNKISYWLCAFPIEPKKDKHYDKDNKYKGMGTRQHEKKRHFLEVLKVGIIKTEMMFPISDEEGGDDKDKGMGTRDEKK